MRHYELMVILDPGLDERTVQPSLETFLNVIRSDGGSVEKVEVWGKRRLAYEINKSAEGIYARNEATFIEQAKSAGPRLSLTRGMSGVGNTWSVRF